MTDHIHLTVCITDQMEKDILIARLFEIGYEGIEEKDNEIHAYIAKQNHNAEFLNQLLDESQLQYSTEIEGFKNWNAVWESSFEPVTIPGFCTIRADFHPSDSSVKHDVIITPKMSFGTGHHATTYLMIREMGNLLFQHKKVADFGTGTGVLAIMSEKLGCDSVLAIDYDDLCIENAAENIEQNKCSKIEVHKAALFSVVDTFDIILANINKNVIIDNLERLMVSLNPGGHILLSGLLKEDEYDVLMACQLYNLSRVKTVEKDNWIAILLEH